MAVINLNNVDANIPMKQIVRLFTVPAGSRCFNLLLLLFRVAISVQLIVVHGLKKLGIGVDNIEIIPNPFGFPAYINNIMAISANIVFPLFVIAGIFTRVATIPVLAVTLTGYFVVHRNDPMLVSDVPFMYSVSFLFILFSGAGKFSLDHLLYKKLGS